MNYLSTSQSVRTLTRGQVSLSESIQYEKQKFPQREGNCLKVSWYHFVSASRSEWEDRMHTGLGAPRHCFEEPGLAGLLEREMVELQLTSSRSSETARKRTNKIAMAKRPLLWR